MPCLVFDLISQPFIVSIDVNARRARVEHFITWIHYESHCVCRLVNPLGKYLHVMYLKKTWARWLRRGWRNLRFGRSLITRTWPHFNQRHKNLSSLPAFGVIKNHSRALLNTIWGNKIAQSGLLSRKNFPSHLNFSFDFSALIYLRAETDSLSPGRHVLLTSFTFLPSCALRNV